MPPVQWIDADRARIFTVDATLTLEEVFRQITEHGFDFVVLARQPGHALDYVFHKSELVQRYWELTDRQSLPLAEALDLHETDASASVPAAARPDELGPRDAGTLPTAGRAVALDDDGHLVAIGLSEPILQAAAPAPPQAAPPPPAPPPPQAAPPPQVELGPPRAANGPGGRTRGGGARGSAPAPAAPAPPAEEKVDVVLSGQAPAEVLVGEEAVIDVRAELQEAATPLAEAVTASIEPAQPLKAILTIEDSRVLEAEGRVLTLAAPSDGKPTTSAFVVKGLVEGMTKVCVLFRQGGSDLGQLAFRVGVVARRTTDHAAEASVAAEGRDPLDDRVVALLIEEEHVGDQIRYRCTVTADLLGLENKPFYSDFVQARGGSTSSASLGYVTSIYKRIVERALLNAGDLDLFQRELKAIGAELSTQLLSGELARLLWDHRDEIVTVKVSSFEPYIPWELLRLKHPDTDETDDRHLAEYGLVRSLNGRAFPKQLRAAEWRYLVGTYPNNLYPKVGGEVAYLTRTLPERRGIQPRAIPAEAAPFLDALGTPDFDVLHVACHGKAELDDIDSTELVIGDRVLTGREVGPVSVTATTVREEAKLRERGPLVFLNACESGQQAPSLTDVGGWPRAFWEAGAGAFVGTSWEVHEKPAARFAESFYEALLDGGTLADSAAKARAEAKKAKDATWLAFTVYGQPTARVS
jgi:hypothetical protein